MSQQIELAIYGCPAGCPDWGVVFHPGSIDELAPYIDEIVEGALGMGLGVSFLVNGEQNPTCPRCAGIRGHVRPELN